VAVFIDGCFWHGCPEHYTRPGSREEFWAGKLKANTTRDRAQTLALDAAGWRTVRVWEHEVFTAPEDVVRGIRRAIEEAAWTPPARTMVVRVDVLDPATRLERHHLEELRGREPPHTVDHIRRTTKWARRST
jgi:DNA mismatch endonuclease (patch repair protein)